MRRPTRAVSSGSYYFARRAPERRKCDACGVPTGIKLADTAQGKLLASDLQLGAQYTVLEQLCGRQHAPCLMVLSAQEKGRRDASSVLRGGAHGQTRRSVGGSSVRCKWVRNTLFGVRYAKAKTRCVLGFLLRKRGACPRQYPAGHGPA